MSDIVSDIFFLCFDFPQILWGAYRMFISQRKKKIGMRRQICKLQFLKWSLSGCVGWFVLKFIDFESQS